MSLDRVASEILRSWKTSFIKCVKQINFLKVEFCRVSTGPSLIQYCINFLKSHSQQIASSVVFPVAQSLWYESYIEAFNRHYITLVVFNAFRLQKKVRVHIFVESHFVLISRYITTPLIGCPQWPRGNKLVVDPQSVENQDLVVNAVITRT